MEKEDIDYLYNLQINETEHQNHRMSWSLAIQAVFLLGVCTFLKQTDGCKCSSVILEQATKYEHHCCCEPGNIVSLTSTIGVNQALIVLLIVVGVLATLSFCYSLIISELTIGHIIDTGNMYGSCKKKVPHVVIAAPKAILESCFKWLAMHRFLPTIFVSAWITIIVIILTYFL